MSSEQLSLTRERKPFAHFSECDLHIGCEPACVDRPYRYLLGWPTGVDNDRICIFVLANPSTATADELDPTVTRCIDYARAWKYGWCWVLNVRAFRATDPKAVPRTREAIGPSNDTIIEAFVRCAQLVVCGWGKLGGARGPVVLELIRKAGKTPHALKLNDDGSPRHPLYLAKNLKPVELPDG